MIPKLASEIPKGSDWFYEVKYDGYRAKLKLQDKIELVSRNGNLLNGEFPEIVALGKYFHQNTDVILDGELVVLESPYKASFYQLRNRRSLSTQAQYLIFDLLVLAGKPMTKLSYTVRRELLEHWAKDVGISQVNPSARATYVPDQDKPTNLFQVVASTTDSNTLWDKIVQYKGEGIIAKKNSSLWLDKRSDECLKIKNWQYGLFVVLGYNKQNGGVYVGTVEGEEILSRGSFYHGLSPRQRETLLAVIQDNQLKAVDNFLTVAPGICVELRYLELYKGQLRQPAFVRFRFDINWKECIL